MQQQNNNSPAVAAQKTYKVKSESKQPQSALLRPENPFSKVGKQAVIVSSIEDSTDNIDSQEEPLQ